MKVKLLLTAVVSGPNSRIKKQEGERQQGHAVCIIAPKLPVMAGSDLPKVVKPPFSGRRLPRRGDNAVVTLRVGSANVGSLRCRSGEIVDMVGRRKLDVCCLQETRWKGGSARTLGVHGARYKLFWSSSVRGLAGVGVLVAEKWVDSVIEVKRLSARLLVLRMAVGKVVVNIVCVYAPQVGRPAEEKEEFLTVLGDVLRRVCDHEDLIVCGDMNCHVGLRADGFESVHGGRGYGVRNAEGEAFLEFATAMNLAVVNTWFVKRESQRISYDSGGNTTTVDYVLVRREKLSMVKDMKVIPSEDCLLQHRLVVCVLKLKACVSKRKRVCVNRRKIWKLKEAGVRQQFKVQFSVRASCKCEDGVEGSWSGLKGCLLDSVDEVCGSTKGLSRHKETWWWNDEVARVVEEKRRTYLAWKSSGNAADKESYYGVKREARRIIAAAQARRREQFAVDLQTAEGKGKLYRVVKQMVKRNADVVGGNCVKDKEGKIVTDEEVVRAVWKDYFEKLLNEEFAWNRDGLEAVDLVSGPCELISVAEVRTALQSMKSGKAVGPSGVSVEMLVRVPTFWKVRESQGILWKFWNFSELVKFGEMFTLFCKFSHRFWYKKPKSVMSHVSLHDILPYLLCRECRETSVGCTKF